MEELNAEEITRREQNLKNILKRLQWLVDKPQGDVVSGQRHYRNTSVLKVETEIHLIFFHQVYHELQSRVDILHPLNLVAPYTQMMLLALLWNENPQHVHMIGLGGGRVPLVLNHFRPEVNIEVSEIDPDVIEIATKYFGFETGANVQVVLGDGRKHLENRVSPSKYDVIIVDAFNGVGFGAQSLATQEFWSVCKNQLVPGGLVIFNILQGDALLFSKIHTIILSFQSLYICQKDGAVVIFAHDGARIDLKELAARAEVLENRLQFPFPFLANAKAFRYLNKITDPVLIENKKIQVLTDQFPHTSLSINKLILAQFNRNDLCPCGSGLKFKKCHGSGLASNDAIKNSKQK